MSAVSKPVWHTPLLCVQWKTPDDGQRKCPKHVEFYSKNKFEKLVHLVGFIIRIYHDAQSPERQTGLRFITMLGHLNVKQAYALHSAATGIGHTPPITCLFYATRTTNAKLHWTEHATNNLRSLITPQLNRKLSFYDGRLGQKHFSEQNIQRNCKRELRWKSRTFFSSGKADPQGIM